MYVSFIKLPTTPNEASRNYLLMLKLTTGRSRMSSISKTLELIYNAILGQLLKNVTGRLGENTVTWTGKMAQWLRAACFSRGPEFNSQQPHGDSQRLVMGSDALFWCV